MINLAQVIEHKYGPCANTASIVKIKVNEIFKETEEAITFRNLVKVGKKITEKDSESDVYQYYTVSIDEIKNLNPKGTPVSFSILQIQADKYKLPYDPAEYNMVITKWNHPTISQPDEKQLQKDLKEYETYLKSIAYKELRRQEYPSPGNQLGALMAGGSELEAMQKKIQAVKKKYPKS